MYLYLLRNLAKEGLVPVKDRDFKRQNKRKNRQCDVVDSQEIVINNALFIYFCLRPQRPDQIANQGKKRRFKESSLIIL